MSKRSGMSRLEDLKHGFIDIGRFRYILHKFDMETWRDKTCYGCGKGFSSDPKMSYGSYSVHGILCMDWAAENLAKNYPEEYYPGFIHSDECKITSLTNGYDCTCDVYGIL